MKLNLSETNVEIVREAVKVAGEELKGRLVPIPGIQTRNPWAHVWKCIKDGMGKSYRECWDSEMPQILALIEESKTYVGDE